MQASDRVVALATRTRRGTGIHDSDSGSSDVAWSPVGTSGSVRIDSSILTERTGRGRKPSERSEDTQRQRR